MAILPPSSIQSNTKVHIGFRGAIHLGIARIQRRGVNALMLENGGDAVGNGGGTGLRDEYGGFFEGVVCG